MHSPHRRLGPPSLRTKASAAALALASAAVLSGCGEEPEQPNFVLVLVDQLRYDAVARWMPRVSELGREGVTFEHMRSAAPWTYPSVISMFSGLYPQQHGADAASGQMLAVFSDQVPLLPRILRGPYYTAAFVTNPFLQKWNPFHTCFDHYAVDEFIGSQGNTRGNPDLVFTDHMFADTVNAQVVEHFDALERTKPEFTYVHYIDVHGPWDGAPFDAQGADHKTTADAAYATAAGYVDARIAELYDYFMARYDGDVVFLVTSDHGQELGDDLEVGGGRTYRQRKATVHDFNTRIPFFVLPSARIRTARTVDASCSNVDVTPTILDWVGSTWPPDLPGRSLLPLIRGEDAPDEVRPIYSVMTAFGRHNDCIVLDERKLIRHFDPTSTEVIKFVYDLHDDPRETKVLSTGFGAEGGLLLRAASTGGREYTSATEAPTIEDLKVMQGIGYFGDEEDGTEGDEEDE